MEPTWSSTMLTFLSFSRDPVSTLDAFLTQCFTSGHYPTSRALEGTPEVPSAFLLQVPAQVGLRWYYASFSRTSVDTGSIEPSIKTYFWKGKSSPGVSGALQNTVNPSSRQIWKWCCNDRRQAFQGRNYLLWAHSKSWAVLPHTNPFSSPQLLTKYLPSTH